MPLIISATPEPPITPLIEPNPLFVIEIVSLLANVIADASNVAVVIVNPLSVAEPPIAPTKSVSPAVFVVKV